MTLSQIAGLGRKLVVFLRLFAGCFGRREPRELLRIYIQGQLSAIHRKTAEGIALEFGKAPRTLQRFLESIKWAEEKLHDRCQHLVAQDHGQRSTGRKGNQLAVVATGGLRSLVGRALLSCGQRRTGDGSLSGPRVALPAPAFLLDTSELLVLCPDTSAVRCAGQRAAGSLDDRTSPQRDKRIPVSRRPEACCAPQATRERPKQATLPPAAQPAGREVPHQNENHPIGRAGHRRQPDQIMYNLTGSPWTYGVSRLGFTATRFAKVALPN